MGRGEGETAEITIELNEPRTDGSRERYSSSSDKNFTWAPEGAILVSDASSLTSGRRVAFARAMIGKHYVDPTYGSPTVSVHLSKQNEIVSFLEIEREDLEIDKYQLYRGKDLSVALERAVRAIRRVPEQDSVIGGPDTPAPWEFDSVTESIARELTNRKLLADAGIEI